MTASLTRKLLTATASATVMLGLAACTSETEGTASRDSSQSSASEESSSSESEPSESEESESSEGEAPSGDTLQSDDGSFEITLPEGFEDAAGQITGSSSATLAIADTASGASFPTVIIVESASVGSTSLDDVAEQVKKNGENAAGASAQDFTASFDSIDGEDYVGYQYPSYDSSGQTLSSLQFATIHDGTAYAITVNALASDTETAGDDVLAFINSWTWLD